jgi:hypothetical protein
MGSIVKDLPIYLNGFAVGMLFFSIEKLDTLDVCMFILAAFTFYWYGKNNNVAS